MGSVAEKFGKLIISEHNIPNRKKTVKECQLGGYLGGSKFIHHGILFKLNEASKAASRELSSVRAFRQCCKNIETPSMVVICYLGRVISAQSIVRISTDTLVYGSQNAGIHIMWDERVHQELSRLKDRFNLAEHDITGASNQLILP